MTGRYTHGSQSIYIEGEGLISTQLGGITGDQPDPVNKSGTPKPTAAKKLAADQAPPFRFSRVGPKGTPLSATVIKKLARAMVVDQGAGGGDGDMPAGFTYLGQFIDHDLTMDKTKVMLGEHVRPIDLVQGRSPRLDLDSLYGNGPATTSPTSSTRQTACTSRSVRRSASHPTARSPATTFRASERARARQPSGSR